MKEFIGIGIMFVSGIIGCLLDILDVAEHKGTYWFLGLVTGIIVMAFCS